ncbi:MAG TPA: TetR/AcrR family transcriptional regulator [Actinomycetota bacterium]|nr:TetR/AcrR family transcriptional regulator [Actinomycetota bacterium]
MAGTGAQTDGGTDASILDVAERLVQTRGFNGFSYADIAQELSVTKASLHYHYPGKADLGRALIDRYAERFADSLAAIGAAEPSPSRALDAYANLYADVFAAHRMCLCGMLAAEYETLPDPMQEAIRGFFDVNEAWLAEVLTRGRRDGSLAFAGSSRETARGIVAGLEGAMLVGRATDGPAGFRAAARRLVRRLAGVQTG